MNSGKNIKRLFEAPTHVEFVYTNSKNLYYAPVFQMDKIKEKYRYTNEIYNFKYSGLLRFLSIVNFVGRGR